MSDGGAGETARKESTDGGPDKGDVVSLSVRKQPATSRLARLWDHTPSFVFGTLLAFLVVPYGTFLLLGVWQGNLHLPGEQQGLFDTPAMLTVCLVVVLVVVAIRYALEQLYDTFRSFNERTLRFADDRSSASLDGEYDRFASTLTREDLRELLSFYEFLLAKATFRGDSDGVSCPERYQSVYQRFRIVFLVALAGGLLLLAVTTTYHWFAEAVYGFDIWASSTYPASFAARFVFEAVAICVVGPWLITSFVLVCYLTYQPFSYLRDRQGLRFHLVSVDGVGGFSAFGNQAFKNLLVLGPFGVQLAVYALFLPTTALLLVAAGLLVLALPTFFLSQLLSAHWAMQDARELELEIIGNAYADNYEAYKELLVETDFDADVDGEDLVTRTETVEKADAIYSQVRNSPTWPFQRTVIAKVASLVFSLISGFAVVFAEGVLF